MDEELEKRANHFIYAFGEYSTEVITKTRNGQLWHPCQEELFKKVEEILQKQ